MQCNCVSIDSSEVSISGGSSDSVIGNSLSVELVVLLLSTFVVIASLAFHVSLLWFHLYADEKGWTEILDTSGMKLSWIKVGGLDGGASSNHFVL